MFHDIIKAGPIVERALLFAAAAHAAVEQKRKYSGEDYINHPMEVCRILMHHGVHNQTILAAALLHDVIEDTGVTEKQLRMYFSKDVADVVMDLTDVSKPEDGNRKTRKDLDRQHSANGSWEAQTAKYADCISNARSIRKDDPDFWKVYRHEMLALLDIMTDGDHVLRHFALLELGAAPPISVSYREHRWGWEGREGEEPLVEGTVSSLEELMKVPFIKRRREGKGFHQFSVAVPGDSKLIDTAVSHLMVESGSPRESKVIGILVGDFKLLGLPYWDDWQIQA
jgi:hypothetical protein